MPKYVKTDKSVNNNEQHLTSIIQRRRLNTFC